MDLPPLSRRLLWAYQLVCILSDNGADNKARGNWGVDQLDGAEVYVVVPSSVTAHVAKRTVNRWLISEVGNLLMADNGSLVETEHGWVWQFEVYMTSVADEAWGPIGTLRVSAVSGKVQNLNEATPQTDKLRVRENLAQIDQGSIFKPSSDQ